MISKVTENMTFLEFIDKNLYLQLYLHNDLVSQHYYVNNKFLLVAFTSEISFKNMRINFEETHYLFTGKLYRIIHCKKFRYKVC